MTHGSRLGVRGLRAVSDCAVDCASHYPNWRDEFPAAASRFQPGGFGENLVLAHMNERNVCIGDIVSVGTDGLILQVSLPRQPCFKLNHRFQLKNFAPNTYKLSRTGWYYRVLQEGTIQVSFLSLFTLRNHREVNYGSTGLSSIFSRQSKIQLP